MMFKSMRYSYIQTYNKHISERYFESVLSNASYSYWFIIYLLSVNLEPMHFRDVILAIDFFKDNQAMPKELLAYDLPLKKRLQNGYDKKDSYKSEKKDESEKEGLVVNMPPEKDEVEVMESNISNLATLERR